VIDTAGYEDEDPETLPGRMRAQTSAAVREADVALFLIDARAGVTPLDEEIGRWLRSETTPVVLAPTSRKDGQGMPVCTRLSRSALANRSRSAPNMAKALPTCSSSCSRIWSVRTPRKKRRKAKARSSSPLSGGPNAGKSTLINRILGQDRLITGPEAGITRDSIAIDWEWQGRPVRLIDTAGMRKKAKVDDKLEKLSVADARRAVDFAEVVVLLLDSTRGLEAQDLRIADNVLQEGRALLIAISKWDVAEGGSGLFNGIRAALEEGLSQARGVPLLTVSGATGKVSTS
jgi:GTP-binding protein